MKKIRLSSKIALMALGMVAANAWATPLTVTGIAGNYIVWDGSTTTLLPTPNAGLSAVTAALGGNAVAPGGNVELSKFGGPVTILAGTGSGHTFTLSSLTLADWTANGNALATRYIQGAATAAFGFQLTAPQLTFALNRFFTLDIDPGVTVLNPWQSVSDPNISYVDINGTTVSIGLAGLLDASPFLTSISGIPLAPGKQASEVVKLSVDGADPTYLFGFAGTPSGIANPVFTANFEIKNVPEPGTLALLGLGIAGMLARRRRL